MCNNRQSSEGLLYRKYTKEITIIDLSDHYENFYIEIDTNEDQLEYYLCHKETPIKRCMFTSPVSDIKRQLLESIVLAFILEDEMAEYASMHMKDEDTYLDVLDMLGRSPLIDEEEESLQGSEYVPTTVISSEIAKDILKISNVYKDYLQDGK